MSHPLDHVLIVSPLRMTFTQTTSTTSPRTLSPNLNCGGLSPLMISLDPRFRPRKVILIHDEKDSMTVRQFETLLSSLSIEIEKWPVDITHIEELTHCIDENLRALGRSLPLCINSDEPLMSAICSQIFLSRGAPILSCIDGSLVRLGLNPQKIPLRPEVTLDRLIAQLGARVESGWEGVWFEEHLEDLSRELIQYAESLAAPLSVIQRLAESADRDQLLSSAVRGGEIALPLFQEVLDRFERAGCVELNQGRLLFSSERHRAYCAGAWLSLYAQMILVNALGKARVWSHRQNLKIELAHPYSLDREIHLSAMVNSHPLFVFCVSSLRDDLDMLEEDSRLLKAHLSAHVMWLSLDQLDQGRRNRLQKDHITLCEGEDLQRLGQLFKDYFCT